jgi:hypothetical protein
MFILRTVPGAIQVRTGGCSGWRRWQSTAGLEAVEESPGRSMHYRQVILLRRRDDVDLRADWLNEYPPPRKDYSEPASVVSPE